MAKVYIDRDNGYFMWDEEIFQILGYHFSPMIEVPDEFIAAYKDHMKKDREFQDQLERFYRESHGIN